MKKLSVKDLVDFRKKSDRGKRIFVERIKSPMIDTPAEGGGNYWVTSLSAVCNAYREDDLSVINGKIEDLRERHSNNRNSGVKKMYQENIDILQRYKSMDRHTWRPVGKLSFQKKSSANPLLMIKGLEVEAKPSQIYTFGKSEEKIAAIWFTAKVNGYRAEEIGMFCDMLYRFLKHNYSKRYALEATYCVAVDMSSGVAVNYSQIESGAIMPLVAPTLDEISKLM